MKKKYLIFFIFFSLQSLAQEVDSLYSTAKKFFYEGNYDSASFYFEKILKVESSNTDLINYKVNYALGYIYYKKNFYNKSIFFFQKAETYLPDLKNLTDEISLYKNIAVAYQDLKKYSESLKYYIKAENKAIGKQDSINLEKIYYNKSILYYNLKENENSLTNIIESIRIAERIKCSTIELNYYQLAKTYYAMNEIRTAEQYFKKAIYIVIQQKKGKTKELAEIYRDLGVLYKNDYNTGYYELNKALTIFTDLYKERHHLLTKTYTQISDYYEIQRDYELALKNIQLAVISAHNTFSDTSWVNNPADFDTYSEIYLIYALKNKADLLFSISENTDENKKDYLRKSYTTYLLTSALIAESNNDYLNNEDKQLLLSDQKEVYSNLIETAFRLYSLTGDTEYLIQAFLVNEKTKSSMLLNRILENEKFFISEKNPDLLLKLNYISQSIGDLRYTTEEENTLYSEKLFGLQRSYNLLLDSLRTETFKLFVNDFNKKIDFDSIKNNITDGENIIEYFINDSAIFIFLLNNKKIRIERVERDSIFEKSLEIVLNHSYKFENYDLSGYRLYYESLFNLYNYLFLPIKNSISGNNICIIPDEELYLLPFELLTSALKDKTTMEYGNADYLINKYNISYHFSTVLKNYNFSAGKFPEKKIAIFAPSYQNIKKYNDSIYNQLININYLTNLEGAKKAATKISQITQADTFTGENITEKLFKEISGNYEILNLSLHSVMYLDSPEKSGLVFGWDTVNNEIGILQNYEIRNLHLNCELTVLDGCNTGLGKIISGEGVMSIARNFYLAGSSTIITTLWSIPDNTSAEIITYFYNFLKQGYNASQSLKSAKLEYLKKADAERSNPYFWAGFILLGESNYYFNPDVKKEPEASSNGFNPMFILTGIGIFLAMLTFVVVRKKKK
jgi:CHAT domain-containing protein